MIICFAHRYFPIAVFFPYGSGLTRDFVRRRRSRTAVAIKDARHIACNPLPSDSPSSFQQTSQMFSSFKFLGPLIFDTAILADEVCYRNTLYTACCSL